MFTLKVIHVTVIANGFQPHSGVQCRKSGCVVCWRMRCGLGVTARRVAYLARRRSRWWTGRVALCASLRAPAALSATIASAETNARVLQLRTRPQITLQQKYVPLVAPFSPRLFQGNLEKTGSAAAVVLITVTSVFPSANYGYERMTRKSRVRTECTARYDHETPFDTCKS